MRLLFLLLVLANLVLFAWAQFVRESSLGTEFARLEVSPEKIRVTAVAGGRAAEPVRPAAPAPTVAACVEWGTFAGADVARADTALAGFALPPERIVRSVADAGGYWVFIPPLKSRAEIDRKVAELKELGVTDFFVVPDAGKWRNAISLGIFKTDEAAQDYLAQLKSRGVRSAVVERRENFLKLVAFLVREPDPALVARLAALQQEFPGSELKATQCPAAAPER